MQNHPQFRAPIAISLGAIAGALCRYHLGQGVMLIADTGLPLGTLIANLSGCVGMGLITTLASDRFSIKPDLLLLITTGFLGSYTTFSSYTLESLRLFDSEQVFAGLVYWLGSPLLGFLGLGIGIGCATLILQFSSRQSK